MAPRRPLFAAERTAAELLDMKPEEFRALVEKGHLPKPHAIGTLQRWSVSDLEKIGAGESIDGGGIEW